MGWCKRARNRSSSRGAQASSRTTPLPTQAISWVYGNAATSSGCRTVVGLLKRSGMYWTVSGANAILALRCWILSGNYEDFWAEWDQNPCVQPKIQT